MSAPMVEPKWGGILLQSHKKETAHDFHDFASRCNAAFN